MVVDLTGVVDNGTARDLSRVPPDSRRTVEIVQGASVKVRLTLYLPSGQPYLVGSATVTLTIKKCPADAPKLSKALTVASGDPPNVATVQLVPNDTLNWCPGRYVYDVWITLAGTREPVVQLSAFVVKSTVGRV